MGMVYGSMRHATNGRKKKTNYWKKTRSYQADFQPMVTKSVYRRETPDYPSVDLTPPSTDQQNGLDQATRQEISSQYTVAPAYNKGAYQVISKENIEHIGR